MKTTLLTIVFCTGMLLSQAQQKPYYTQYIMNNYILNPALSGIENYMDVKLSYRNQWNDIVGAPVTMYFSAHAPINKKDFRNTPTSFELPGENPLGKCTGRNTRQPNRMVVWVSLPLATKPVTSTAVHCILLSPRN